MKCISKEESENIYKIYKTNGWLSEMKNDVERVGANWEKFLLTEPEILFNVKFKFDDLTQPDELIEIELFGGGLDTVSSKPSTTFNVASFYE